MFVLSVWVGLPFVSTYWIRFYIPPFLLGFYVPHFVCHMDSRVPNQATNEHNILSSLLSISAICFQPQQD